MKLIASLSLAAVLAASPLSALAFDAPSHEAKTGIAAAFMAGQLDERLIDIHTNHLLTPWQLERAAWQANVAAVRRFAICALTPSACKAAPMAE